MKFKRLLPKSIKGHITIDEFIATELFKEKELYGESLMNVDSPTIIIKNKSGKLTDFIIGGTALLIISGKAKKFFEENIEYSNIEFIPVKVNNYKKSDDFWILHILEKINCFDWEKSDYTLFDELGPNGDKQIRRISKMILREDVIEGKEIFYVNESPAFVHITEYFGQKLLRSDLIGFRFI